MMGFVRNIGGPELLIVLAVVLLLFGASRLPSLARSLGESARELRRGMAEGVEDDTESDEAESPDSA
jgi:sec-independent protein translocase protein TatA